MLQPVAFAYVLKSLHEAMLELLHQMCLCLHLRICKRLHLRLCWKNRCRWPYASASDRLLHYLRQSRDDLSWDSSDSSLRTRSTSGVR